MLEYHRDMEKVEHPELNAETSAFPYDLECSACLFHANFVQCEGALFQAAVGVARSRCQHLLIVG